MPILQKPYLAEETLLFPYAVSTRSASITLDFLSPVLHGSRAVSSRSRGGFANLLHAQEGRCRAPSIAPQISVLAGIRATQEYGAPIPRDPSAIPRCARFFHFELERQSTPPDERIRRRESDNTDDRQPGR